MALKYLGLITNLSLAFFALYCRARPGAGFAFLAVPVFFYRKERLKSLVGGKEKEKLLCPPEEDRGVIYYN